MRRHAIERRHDTGCVDLLEIDPTGIVRVSGWSTDSDLRAELVVDGAPIQPLARYRTYRPDVERVFGVAHAFAGLELEYLLRPTGGVVERLELRVNGETALGIAPNLRIGVPAYENLLVTPAVQHRGDIYSSGPPVDAVAADVLALASSLPGPLLDFGCGRGALLKRLRARGIEAQGLEIDRPGISEFLDEDTRRFVQMYGGALPAPYQDGQFESVTCVEVLEHCEGPDAVAAELARLTRDRCLVTVPDISAVPLCFRHRVVPWHLLEATHVNFFTQASLEQLLRRHFSRVEMARIGEDAVNGMRFFTSVAALCRR